MFYFFPRMTSQLAMQQSGCICSAEHHHPIGERGGNFFFWIKKFVGRVELIADLQLSELHELVSQRLSFEPKDG